MRSLVHALNRAKSSGRPLPDRFPSLAANGIRIRTGQLTMVAGQPGSCKSLFSLDYAVHTGVYTLYISADSDDSTVVGRVGAMRLGHTVDEIEDMIETDARVLVEEELADLSNIRFVFSPQPTLGDLEEELQAFECVYGVFPQLIVVDNLINVVCETTNEEWTGLRHLMAAMHTMARETEAAVLILHHTSEGEGKSDVPQARKALMGKVAQLPEVILTCALDPNAGEFKLAAVKNRSGKADATGGTFVTLNVDLPRMALSEQPVLIERAERSAAVDQYWAEIQ